MAYSKETIRDWLKASRAKAPLILEHAKSLAPSAFSSQQNFVSFLDLTSRLHYYDVYNLLLIWEKYPSASYLAGIETWKQWLPNAMVLKPEATGKGIELIAPFTEAVSSQLQLTWFTVNVYDISQTNIPAAPPVFDDAYIHDEDHLYYMLDALVIALGEKYDRTVVVKAPTQVMLEVGLPVQMRHNSVIVSKDMPVQDQVFWLTEVLAQLAIPDAGLSAPALAFLKSSISYFLFQVWGLQELAAPPVISVFQPEADHEDFLLLFRDTARELNNLVSSCYTQKRKKDDAMFVFPESEFADVM